MPLVPAGRSIVWLAARRLSGLPVPKSGSVNVRAVHGHRAARRPPGASSAEAWNASPFPSASAVPALLVELEIMYCRRSSSRSGAAEKLECVTAGSWVAVDSVPGPRRVVARLVLRVRVQGVRPGPGNTDCQRLRSRAVEGDYLRRGGLVVEGTSSRPHTNSVAGSVDGSLEVIVNDTESGGRVQENPPSPSGRAGRPGRRRSGSAATRPSTRPAPRCCRCSPRPSTRPPCRPLGHW